jgi:hypothetical protein
MLKRPRAQAFAVRGLPPGCAAPRLPLRSVSVPCGRGAAGTNKWAQASLSTPCAGRRSCTEQVQAGGQPAHSAVEPPPMRPPANTHCYASPSGPHCCRGSGARGSLMRAAAGPAPLRKPVRTTILMCDAESVQLHVSSRHARVCVRIVIDRCRAVAGLKVKGVLRLEERGDALPGGVGGEAGAAGRVRRKGIEGVGGRRGGLGFPAGSSAGVWNGTRPGV